MDCGFRKVKIERSSISDYVSNLAFILGKKCVLYLFYFLELELLSKIFISIKTQFNDLCIRQRRIF